MKVLVIGAGGREHAIAKKISLSERVEKVFVSPGNPGMKDYAEIVKLTDFKKIADFVEKSEVDFVIVGPEQPLAEGIVDFLEEKNISVVGPSKAAAEIESSKKFSKDMMKKYEIPTAAYGTISEKEKALKYLKNVNWPQVIKADGLAAGKGVYIVNSFEEAEAALNEIMEAKKFGSAGDEVVIEEFLEGWEASIFAFCDGDNFISTIFSQDHKKAYDGGKGPNTGGMGAYAPVKSAEKYKDFVDKEVFEKIIEGMKKEGKPFKGILFAGLMFTESGPKVLEFNCRFGDPETEVILPLMRTDLVDICEAVINKKINEIDLSWKRQSALTLVGASEGYPLSYEKGKRIEISPEFDKKRFQIYFAGVKEEKNRLVTNGGRIFMLTNIDDTIMKAKENVYKEIEKIKIENLFYRTDIGDKKF